MTLGNLPVARDDAVGVSSKEDNIMYQLFVDMPSPLIRQNDTSYTGHSLGRSKTLGASGTVVDGRESCVVQRGILPREKNTSTDRIYTGKSHTHGQVTAKPITPSSESEASKDVQDVSVPRYVQSGCVRKRANIEAQLKSLEQYPHVLVLTLRPSFIPRLPSTRSSPGGPVHMTPRRPTRSSKKKGGEKHLKRALMLYLDIAQGTKPSGRTVILLKFSSQRQNSSRPPGELNPSVSHLTLPNSLCI